MNDDTINDENQIITNTNCIGHVKTSILSQPTQINSVGKRILEEYVLFELIGSGTFGEVYIVQHMNGTYSAVKIESRKRPPRMINEHKIYSYLYKCGFRVGIPKIYDWIETPDYNYMFMQLLGPSLEDLFNKYNKKFKLSTIFSVAIQLIELLQSLHECKFIHRDIKPNNFLIGRTDKHQLYIMDFGLSKKYINEGSHIKFRESRSLIGTARYASINMHMGIEPSRRDDLESIAYMLIYFAKGSLPWQGLKKKNGADKNLEAIGEIKIATSIDILCSGLHSCFKDYLVYCRKLKFEQMPDYTYITNLFQNAMTESRMNFDVAYEWEN